MRAPRTARLMARPSRWCVLTAALLLGSLVPALHAAERERTFFELPTAKVRVVDGVYLLDAVARLELTPAVRQALESGVDLTIRWEVDIERWRSWWLNAEVTQIVQQFELAYHELSQQYVVTNRKTGQRHSYTRLATALEQIGTLIGFPLVDRVLITNGGRYVGAARARLQLDTLPLPVWTMALFSPDWNLRTPWHRWAFE